MRITIPDLPQLAQTRTSRGISLASDTRGLQTLAASTQEAFQAASNAANEFWKLELQEDENEQLAAAVTKYGAGLDEASNQALAAAPTQARTVFEAAAATAMTDIRGGLTNKQALLRFNLHAAGKYTTRATEQRKLARKRILEGKVFRANNRVQELNRIAGDINLSVLERSEATRALFGMNVPGAPVEIGVIEQAVIDGTYDGEPAATLLHESRVKILTNLATGFVMQSNDPELTVMHLQQVGDGFEKTDVEIEIRSMLSFLEATPRAKFLEDLGNRATEIATDRAARLTRKREAATAENTEIYNQAFDLDVPLDELYRIRDVLKQWPGYKREYRERLNNHIAQRAAGGTRFANVDISNSIVSIQDKLSTQTLTAVDLAEHQGKLTQATYEKFRQAIRTQNHDGFTRANGLIMREFRYEKYKTADNTDALVRASQAAAQNAQAEMLEWLQTNPKATPAESFAQAEKLIQDERLGFRSTILAARKDYLASVQSLLGGPFITDDPLAELEARFALPSGTPGHVVQMKTTLIHLQRLRDYKEQLGDD